MRAHIAENADKVGRAGVVIAHDKILAFGGKIPVYALERIAEAVFAHVADLEPVIAVGQLYRAVCRVRRRAVIVVADTEAARQHLDRLKCVDIYAPAENAHKIVNIKASYADLIGAAKAELYCIFYGIRPVRRKRDAHAPVAAPHRVAARQTEYHLGERKRHDRLVYHTEVVIVGRELFYSAVLGEHMYAQ